MRELDVDGAVAVLRSGGIVAIPTETVYGLAADATRPEALARVFAAKGRPPSHPLIVHLPSAEALDGWVSAVPPLARRLADVLWPGPLTLLFRRGPRALDAVTGGLPTVAIRVPAHPLARAVIDRVGALAAPSANRFGAVSPTSADHVRADLEGRIDGVLDGGPCPVGIESTIVDVSNGAACILRPGGVPRETLEEILGVPVPLASESKPRAPGMLASHYAPRARVVAATSSEAAAQARALARAHPHARVAVLSPAPVNVDGVEWMAAPLDPVERARTLYASLRALDERGVAHAVVVLPPDERGLDLAIADRLRRAAGPR